MTTIEDIIAQITDNTKLGEAQRAILESLAITAYRTEELFKIELMNKIDNDINEKIPVKKMSDLKSIIGVHTKDTTFNNIHENVSLLMQPVLEDSSCLVARIIPRLFAYSLYLLFEDIGNMYRTITRRYVYTDRASIYKLELLICAYKNPCPSLLNTVSSVYCVVGSKSTVDVNRIDFPTLADFYQLQLSAHGIEEKALNYLFYEIKDTYYNLKSPNYPPHID